MRVYMMRSMWIMGLRMRRNWREMSAWWGLPTMKSEILRRSWKIRRSSASGLNWVESVFDCKTGGEGGGAAVELYEGSWEGFMGI